MKILQMTLLILFTLVLIVITSGSILALADLYNNWFVFNLPWIYFAAGSLICLFLLLILYFLWRWNWLTGLTKQFLFLHRFQHDLVHMILGLFTFSGVYSFNVSFSGGDVNIGNSPLSFLTALSPYLVSIPLLLMLSYIIFINPFASLYAYLLLGSAYSYHSLTVICSAKPQKKEFEHSTYPVGLLWVVCFLMLLSYFTAATVAGGRREALLFANQTIAFSKVIATHLAQKIMIFF